MIVYKKKVFHFLFTIFKGNLPMEAIKLIYKILTLKCSTGFKWPKEMPLWSLIPIFLGLLGLFLVLGFISKLRETK